MTVRTLTRVAAIAALPVFPATAKADDASLFRAYQSRGNQMDRALDEYTKASRRFQRSHGPAVGRARAVIRSNGKIIAILDKIVPDVKAEEPSSDLGRKAKPLALKGLRAWRWANVYERRALRAYIHGHGVKEDRLYERARRSIDRSVRYLGRADATFKKAGFS
jgi:hypothetical protein